MESPVWARFGHSLIFDINERFKPNTARWTSDISASETHYHLARPNFDRCMIFVRNQLGCHKIWRSQKPRTPWSLPWHQLLWQRVTKHCPVVEAAHGKEPIPDLRIALFCLAELRAVLQENVLLVQVKLMTSFSFSPRLAMGIECLFNQDLRNKIHSLLLLRSPACLSTHPVHHHRYHYNGLHFLTMTLAVNRSQCAPRYYQDIIFMTDRWCSVRPIRP